ncbi:hypothetical protein GQ55_1G194900 [Panicum hallii var. hallii]|uniref:Uncharacterized protein n=1 Tax=Panicum hallii var. hallii TaxID=1504633 RepID=A0A2T7F6A9_9POAL|nr:hypothetical protein GQ55_1G194900 [Panicum hallii var. hallii]
MPLWSTVIPRRRRRSVPSPRLPRFPSSSLSGAAAPSTELLPISTPAAVALHPHPGSGSPSPTPSCAPSAPQQWRGRRTPGAHGGSTSASPLSSSVAPRLVVALDSSRSVPGRPQAVARLQAAPAPSYARPSCGGEKETCFYVVVRGRPEAERKTSLFSDLL